MNPQVKPLLTKLMVVIPLLVIGLFLTCITVILPFAVANHGYDSRQFLPTALFILFLATGSYILYLTVFRQDMDSTEFLASCVFAFSSLVFLGSFGLFEVELRSTKFSNIPAESFYTIMFFFCAAAFAGLFSWLKYIKHKIRSVSLPTKTEKRRFYLREFFHLSVVLLFIVLNAFNLLITDFDSYRTPYKRQTEIFASREEAPITLPENATRIHFSRRYNKHVCIEFSTDEQSFVDWVEAETKPWPPHLKESLIHEIDHIAIISRFYGNQRTYLGPSYTKFKEGLEYDRLLRKVDFHAIYDRTSGRAYCTRTKYP